MAVELFYSYSHKDEDLRAELERHLSLLRRSGHISEWHDRRIEPGAAWKGEIDSHLRSARIILLLISSDFLASDYCYDIEAKLALERHQRGEAVVIPIILRPVDWTAAPFAALQGLPRDAKAITTWTNRDEAFLDVARGIRQAVMILAAAAASEPETTPTLPPAFEREQSRILDAALPKRVTVGSAVELMALIRRSESGGLRAVLQVEEEPGLAPEDVKSRPFRIEFPLDVTGRAAPVTVSLKIDSPQFEPRSQMKEIRVPPDRDSEVCRFLLVPQQAGQLRVMLEAVVQGIYQTARVLLTNAETAPVPQPAGILVVSLPLFTVSGTATRMAGATQVFGTPPPQPVAPPPAVPPPAPAAKPDRIPVPSDFTMIIQPSPNPTAPAPAPISRPASRPSYSWAKGLAAAAMVTVAILAGYNYLTLGRTASPPIAARPTDQTAALEIRVVDHLGAPVSGATVRHEGVVAMTNDLGIAKLGVSAAARKPVEVVVAPPNGPEMKVSAEIGIRKEVTLAAPPRPHSRGATVAPAPKIARPH